METSKNSTSKNFEESSQKMMESFGNITASMTEFYKAQVKIANSYYNNFFNPAFMGSKTNGNIYNLWMDSMFIPFSNHNSVHAFNKALNQATVYQQNLLKSMAQPFNADGFEAKDFTEKYQKTINEEFERFKQLMNLYKDTYDKHVTSSIETGIHLQEEANKQIGSLMASIQRLWFGSLNNKSEPSKIYDRSTDGEHTDHKANSKKVTA